MNLPRCITAALFLCSTGAFAADTAEGSQQEQTNDSATEEVIVFGTRKAFYTEITESAEKLVEMPGSMGDPLGAITALPGVITPADGGEPAVRGSSPDDNRYYIDGIPAGYIFHEFNTSIFDEKVIQDFQLFSAGFGAQYSGATGAVFDVRLRDPQDIPFETSINLSLLRAGIFLESRVTENSAFYLSAREGLIQFFLPEDDEANEEGFRIISAPEDRDYQAKYLWDINSNNSLSILLAGAEDYAEAEITDKAGFVQENPDFAGDALLENSFNSQGVTWKHDFDNGGESSFIIANYVDKERLEWGDDYYFESVLDDTIIKGQLALPAGSKHTITTGFEYNDYRYDYGARVVLFLCTEFDVDCQDGRGGVVEPRDTIEIRDTSLYVIDSWQMTNNFSIETGLQWNQYKNKSNNTDENFINPRIAAQWQAWPKVAITSSAGRYNRLPNIDTIIEETGNPLLKSPRSDHFTLGLKGEIGLDWNWSVEAYHKTLSELPLALDDDHPDAEQRYSNDVEGTARGFDLFLNRNLADDWYGWVSLSYSTSDRTNTRTNDTRDYFLDTPLVLNVVGNYQLSEKWNTGFRLTAKSGQATTKIIGVEPNPDFPDNYLPVYAEPYQDRLPTYVQLNLRAKREITMFGKDGRFFIDILNALNRKNVASRELDYPKVNETGELHIENEVGMEIFPSIGFSMTF